MNALTELHRIMNFIGEIYSYWDEVPNRLSPKEESLRTKGWNSIMDKIHHKEKVNSIMKVSAITLVAASLLFIVLFSALSKKTVSPKPVEISLLASTSETVFLPDGTQVWTDTGTKLSYYSDRKKERRVQLSGNATFDVAKDPDGKHFHIEMDDSYIEVKGTSFSVSQLSAHQISVSLFTGVLDFVSRSSGQVLTLAPSSSVVYNLENKSMLTSAFSEKITFGDGYYGIDGASLSDIVEFLKIRYHVNIQIASSVGDNQKMTGRIPFNESLASVLNKISYMLNLQYSRSGNNYLFFRKH